MSEAQEQEAVVDWCAWKSVPVFAIPNGGKRNKREAANLVRQGVKSGVPDLMVPVARGGYHGLFVEMKYGRNKTTDKQDEWLALLSEQGYKAVVCNGAQQAIRVISQYLMR